MIDLAQKKWIIFDLDGTIAKLGVDWPLCRKEVKEILIKKYPQLEIIFEDEQRKLEKQGEKLTVELMGMVAYKNLGHDVYADFKSIQERYETSYGLEDMKISNNLVEFIKKNKEVYKFAICSNNSFLGVRYALDLLSLGQEFSLIESRKQGRPPKPDLVIIKDLLISIGADVDKCLYVGDNPVTDGELAEGIGMDYIDYRDLIY